MSPSTSLTLADWGVSDPQPFSFAFIVMIIILTNHPKHPIAGEATHAIHAHVDEYLAYTHDLLGMDPLGTNILLNNETIAMLVEQMEVAERISLQHAEDLTLGGTCELVDNVML